MEQPKKKYCGFDVIEDDSIPEGTFKLAKNLLEEQPKKSSWEEEFMETVMAKYYGACFECCDFEKLTEEYLQFIKKTIDKQKEYLKESLKVSVEQLDAPYKDVACDYEDHVNKYDVIKLINSL